ncbi:MAG: GxxExxY protein, partial [Bacteroidota bacterium]
IIEVHRDFGPGLFESVYEKVLFERLTRKGLQVKAQVPICIDEEGLREVVAFKIDLLVNDLLIIEIKSVEQLSRVHFKQLQTYLRLTNLKLGILVNFNVEKVFKQGIHRVVNNL